MLRVALGHAKIDQSSSFSPTSLAFASRTVPVRETVQSDLEGYATAVVTRSEVPTKFDPNGVRSGSQASAEDIKVDNKI